MTALAAAAAQPAPAVKARGALQVNGIALSDGDGALLDGENTLTLHDGHHAEVLVFDLARRWNASPQRLELAP